MEPLKVGSFEEWDTGTEAQALCSEAVNSEQYRTTDCTLYAQAAFYAGQRAANEALVAALKDAMSGLAYIRMMNGPLYGVGWDRMEQGAVAALALVEPKP